MAETIEIVFSPDGAVKIETSGFKGKACQDATREIEKALGVKQSETLKAEFYEPVEVNKAKVGR